MWKISLGFPSRWGEEALLSLIDIFEDYLLLFAEAFVTKSVLIRVVFRDFSEVSGQVVNQANFKVFISANTCIKLKIPSLTVSPLRRPWDLPGVSL